MSLQLVVSRNRYSYSNFECVQSLDDIEWSNVSVLIFNSCKDDEVKTASGFSNITYKKVTDVMKKEYNGDIIKVKVKAANKEAKTIDFVVVKETGDQDGDK